MSRVPDPLIREKTGAETVYCGLQMVRAGRIWTWGQPRFLEDAATEAKMPPEMLQKGITNAPARGIPVKHPLLHRTRSLDYAIILSGEIDMMLDDGDVHLKPGDVIVQQATNHAWVNRGKEPCRILFVLMDSKEP